MTNYKIIVLKDNGPKRISKKYLDSIKRKNENLLETFNRVAKADGYHASMLLHESKRFYYFC